jgi:uncharacterized protein (TIGR03437 family)
MFMFRALVVLLITVSGSQAQPYLMSTLAGGLPPLTPAAATGVSIGDPPRVATDSAGNLYFGSLHSIFKVDPSGTLTRIAGTGRSGLTGDGGPALNAQLQFPDAIAFDAAGNLYFSERDANLIRRISTAGNVTTFAGTGTGGYAGDGGPALSAQFNGPTGLAFDKAGNLYVADTGNSVIRRIAPDGTVTKVAGSGTAGYGGDGAPAVRADLNSPQGVAVDAAGNLYIADTFNNRVRMVAPDGTMSTFAANGYPGFSGDGVAAIGTTLFFPTDVAVDPSGNVYIADFGNSRIREVSGGVISTIAGSTALAPIADDVSATSIRLNGPTGVAVDNSGNVYFAEGSVGPGSGLAVGDYRVWRVAPSGTLTAAAGNGLQSFSGDAGAASRAQLNSPTGMALDGAGNLYFADTANHRIRRISPGGTITTVAGNALPGFSGDGGAATLAELNSPAGVAVDASGILYIADSANNRVRRVGTDGTISTIVGNGNAALFGDGGPALAAALNTPQGVVVDASGNLYIADTLNHCIRKVDTKGQISTAVGSLVAPRAVAVSSSGVLYVADAGIRVIAPNGAGLLPGSDSTTPQGVTLDATGNVYYSAGNQVRRVSAAGTATVVAGTGACCYAGDGGPASAALLNQPSGVAVDRAGNVYIADNGNDAIRVAYASSTGSFIRSVANGASNLSGALAPGEVVTIYGAGLGPAQLAQFTAVGGVVPKTLAGTTVLFNGMAGPVLYTEAGQVAAVVPYGVTGSQVSIVVQYGGQPTAAFPLPLAASAPGLFSADSSGAGQALAINSDGTENSTAHPAASGSVITLFGTGEGQSSPAGVDGLLAAAPFAHPSQPLAVWIGGQPAQVQYAGGAAGEVAGVMRVDVQVPAGLSGTVPVALLVGYGTSQTLTITVGQ